MLQSHFVLGIIGDGQLARMTALAAFNFGLKVYIYGENSDSPAGLVATKFFIGDYNDQEKLLAFAQHCKVITLENEFINSEILFFLEKNSSCQIYPSPKSFQAIENKWIEKTNIEKLGLPVAPFLLIRRESDLQQFIACHGDELIIKSSKGGYDGYGTIKVKGAEEASKVWKKLRGDDKNPREVIAEKLIPFKAELAIMVFSNGKETITFPLTETIQSKGICHSVIAPATTSKEINEQAESYAVTLIQGLSYQGVLGIEFFLTNENQLLINETAPRPHNSGHFSMNALNYSQFEGQVRAVMSLPLPPVQKLHPYTLMLNLLGTQNGPAEFIPPDDFFTLNNAHLHLYGKKESRIGRKMGHVNFTGSSLEKLKKQLSSLQENYQL